MSWTRHTPSRAASETRLFMGTPAFTLASRQWIQTALTSVSTLKQQLTSYIKPWRTKMVTYNVTAVIHWNLHIFSTFSQFPLHSQSFASSTGRVLVHCIMGVSRSATLVLAYLMLQQRLCLRDALRHVIQKRAIYPNQHFLSLLLKLDERLMLRRRLCPFLWFLHISHQSPLFFSMIHST